MNFQSKFPFFKQCYFLAIGLVFSLFISSNLSAQHVCGISEESVKEGIPAMMQTREDWQRFKANFSGAASERSADYIPVKIHVIRRSNKTGGISKENINEGIALVNSIYIEANIQLEVCGSINYIDSDKYYTFVEAEENDLVSEHYVNGVLNIYYTGSVGGYCGYAKFPWKSRDLIIMPNSCAMNESTFPHEVGHYFGLLHTHETALGKELVTRGTGKNCESAGDGLCDTAADPRLSGTSALTKVNSNCEYVGTKKDANNETYVPDPHNLMSYSLKPCRDYFSEEQIARIRYYFEKDRQDLTCGAEYCETKGDGTTKWIEKVEFGSIKNQSGSDEGYGKYIDVSTRVKRGQQVQLTLGHGTNGAHFWSSWNVWIDYNHNNQFENSERILILGYQTSAMNQYVYNVTIPNNAQIGSTRMRVTMTEGSPTACGDFTKGETEDYTIYIEKSGDGYCTARGKDSENNFIQSISFAGINNNSGHDDGYGNYSSQKATVEVGKTYNISFSQNQTLLKLNANHWKVWVDWNQDKVFNDDPTEFMGYHWTSFFEPSRTFGIKIPAHAKVGETKMRILMNGELSNFEGCSHMTYGEVEDYTIVIPENYCNAKANNGNYEWIDKVIFQSVEEDQNEATKMVENHSGKNNGYGNYKNIKVRMQQGLSYPVIMVPGFGNAAYDENYRIWIDLNKDGDYNDTNELMFETEKGTKSAVQAFINIPPDSHIGETRMRIAMRWAGNGNNKPGVCDTYSYGEVEDYTIDILEMSVGVDEIGNTPTLFELPDPTISDDKLSPRELEMSVSPNPSQGFTTVKLDLGYEQAIEIQVLSILGKSIKTFRPNKTKSLNYELDLSDLSGGAYIIRVKGNDFGISKKLVLMQN